MSAIDTGREALRAWDATRPTNFFSGDQDLARTLRTRLGHAGLHEASDALDAVGRDAGGPLARLARETNQEAHLPRLERFDGLGQRTEKVVFHPSYHQAGALIWKSGVLSMYAEPGRETEQLARLYLFSQNGELGHLCPLACTAGLIKVIQAVGSESQRARWLPGLLATDYDTRIHASQFLTEVQGGSDVGANAVEARPDGDHFRIYGEKWFCSVIDAQLFLLTARPPQAPDGTRGLGLFVVPREVDGRTNDFHVRRLKWKLGTRAMASAETDFVGAYAEQLGPLEQGFRNVVERVLDTSRVFNAICCAGAMRRSYLEASRYAAHRTAFGVPIARFPLIREAVATLRSESMAALASTMRIARRGDAVALGACDNDQIASRRMAVNINKYWTSVRNTQMARLAMEVLGGNGAIESFSVIPQLYRDAMVLESWEGTHNTLVAQVLRDTQKLGLHRPFIADLEEALGAVSHVDPSLVDVVRAGIDATKAPLDALSDGEGDQRWARRVVDQLAVSHALVALIEEADQAPDDEAAPSAIRFLAARDLHQEIPKPAPIPASLS